MTMARNYVLVALLSFFIVLWSHAFHTILNAIYHAYSWIANWGAFNFAGYKMGQTPRHIIALTAIPIFAGVFSYFIFWLLKKEPSEFISAITWCVWLVLATILLVHAA